MKEVSNNNNKAVTSEVQPWLVELVGEGFVQGRLLIRDIKTVH